MNGQKKRILHGEKVTREDEVGYTLVTAVPARKKTPRRAKKTLQGCRAWTDAVIAATTRPSGVSDFREWAR